MRAFGRQKGRYSRLLSAATGAILALALAGCASLAGKSPPAAYNLSAATDFPRRAGPARGQLVIAEPAMLGPLDSEKILVRPSPGQAAQLPDAQWEDRLPKLLQARILQSFENAHRLRAVGRAGDRIATDFVLLTEVRHFEVSAAEGQAVVEIAAKIVRERSGRIIAARVIRVSVPVAQAQAPAAIAGLNQAFVKAATQLVLWAETVV